MKKIKMIAATLVAAMLAAAGWSMVACNDGTAFTVTLDANGGVYSDGATTKSVEVNSEHTLSDKVEAPTRDGWEFNGYTVKKDGEGEKIVFGLDGSKFTKSTTIYAQWRIAGRYMITFDANGGTLIGSATQMTVGGKLALIPDNTHVSYNGDDGAFFYGWWTDPTGGEEITVDTVFDCDTTIYVHWAKAEDDDPPAPTTEYTITFDGNGGTVSGTATAKTSGGKLVTLVDGALATKDGFTFDGWYTQADGGAQVTLQTAFTADTTVYAHWTEVSTPDPEPEEGYMFYLLGMVGKVNKWDIKKGYPFTEVTEDLPEGVWKQFKVDIELRKGDEVKIFRAKKTDVEWSYNNFENGDTEFGKLESNYKVLKSGTFTFYLKLYDNDPEGGDGVDDDSKVYVGWVESETPDPVGIDDFYLVGSMTGWAPDAEYKLVDNEITVELEAGAAFKLAMSTADGTTAWDDDKYGGSAVTVGKDYLILGDKDDNIVVAKAGKYTVKLVDGHVEITSEDVETDPDIKRSGTITFKDEKTVVFEVYVPSWVDESSIRLYVFEEGKDVPFSWPGTAIKDGLQATDIELENAQIIVYFKKGTSEYQSADTPLTGKVENGKTYSVTINTWGDNNRFTLSLELVEQEAEQTPEQE